MKECCANCCRKYKLEIFDYRNGGCEHSKPTGYICMAFSGERTAVWMIGANEDRDLCECFEPKEETK